MSVPKLVDQVRYGWDHSLSCIIMQGAARGEVKITSDNPSAQPELLYNYMDDRADLSVMREALRMCADLLEMAPYRSIGARRVSPTTEELRTDHVLNKFISEHVGTSIHMAGTCQMGEAADTSVVDQYCRVHGIDGLRIVDTSIMPVVVRRCPAATAVMLGERAAAFFD